MIPLSDSWSQNGSDLYTDQREENKIQIIQILQILRISQYIEVKSEKILKIYQEILGFHQYILKYPQKQDEYNA